MNTFKNAYIKWVGKVKRGIYMMDQNQGLKRELKSRHIFMIALGGVIGTGLF